MKHCKSEMHETLQPLPDSVTFCATVDECGTEKVITDMMIRRACEQMDAGQIWPFSSDMKTRPLKTLNTGSAQILSFPARTH